MSSFFKAHWSGSQPLMSAFWGVGIVGSVVVFFVAYKFILFLNGSIF